MMMMGRTKEKPAKCGTCRLTETARLLKNVKSVFTRRSNAATRVNVEVELSRKSSGARRRHTADAPCRPLSLSRKANRPHYDYDYHHSDLTFSSSIF